jgi:hypothetical protein
MLSSNKSYFPERSLPTWKNLSFGGAMGFMVAQDGGSMASAAMAASLFLIPTIQNAIEAHRERNGDKLPLPVATAGDGDRRTFKEEAASKWLAELKSKLSFEDFVTELADCSLQYGRRFSVTCVKIAGLSEAKTELVASLLRRNVRATDEIKCVSDGEFLVCSPLLRDAVSAETILKRLENALMGSDLLDAGASLQLGKAVCPRDGYSAPDLIEAARGALRPAGLADREDDMAATPSMQGASTRNTIDA